jgi:hypothetical protein
MPARVVGLPSIGCTAGYSIPRELTKCCLSDGVKLILHAFDKILCPSRRGDNPIGHSLAQFLTGGTGMLRDREVLGQSVRAVDRDSTGHPDQLAGFNVEDFGEFVIKNLVAGLHRGTSGRFGYLYL